MAPPLFTNWRAAWESMLDNTDPSYAAQQPTPDQSKVMDQQFGSLHVHLYCDTATYPHPVGLPRGRLVTYKDELDEEDILTVHTNGVYAALSVTHMDSGMYAVFQVARRYGKPGYRI